MTPLNAREIEILTLVARGWQDKQIAQAVDLSLSRVRQMVGTISRKLGATNRVQSCVVAFAKGIVSLDEAYASVYKREDWR